MKKKDEWILLALIAAGVLAVVTATVVIVRKIGKKRKIKKAEELAAWEAAEIEA